MLALREHSRAELERKLAGHARSADQVRGVLDDLERAGHLSNERFVQSLVQRRAARYGVRRIEQELAGHRVEPDALANAMRELRVSERERALRVWRKRFGTPPADLAERARQHRFLSLRGFDPETIAWVLRHSGEDSGDDA